MKKISFLFLIYDQIHHEDIWKAFFEGVDPNLYTIHIHYKTQKLLRHFEQYKVANPIPTKYVDFSIVLADNLLIQTAFRDPDVYKTINLSQSCIPLKPFHVIYKELTSTPCSIFNEAPQSQCFTHGRCDSLLPHFHKDKISKSSNWFILNREHADIVLHSTQELEWFRNIECPEEYYFITIIRAKGNSRALITTMNESEKATTFTNWQGNEYKFVHNHGLKRYHDIDYNELYYLLSAPCLFGRKFEEDCKVNRTIPLLQYIRPFIQTSPSMPASTTASAQD